MHVDERGPVRARARITATYVWPDHVDGSSQARVGEHHVAVDTDVEVRADDAAVRVTTSFVNPSGDHRLRVHLPLPEPADHSHAESAFTVVTRGLTAEGRADEFGLPTAPANRFVTAGRLTVVHEGVCEYELIDIEGDAAKTIALTVLRSTGMLSRLGMAYRPFPAGPVTPVEGLQMRGKRVDAALRARSRLRGPVPPRRRRPAPARTGARPSAAAAAPRRAASWRSTAPRSAHSTGSPACSSSGSSTPAPRRTVVSIPGRSGWLVDLRGYPLEPFEGSFELRPFGIATARLRGD